MTELIAPAMAFGGLIIASALYYLMVRRRGRDRHRMRADYWDRAMSQARTVERLRSLVDRDRRPPD